MSSGLAILLCLAFIFLVVSGLICLSRCARKVTGERGSKLSKLDRAIEKAADQLHEEIKRQFTMEKLDDDVPIITVKATVSEKGQPSAVLTITFEIIAAEDELVEDVAKTNGLSGDTEAAVKAKIFGVKS